MNMQDSSEEDKNKYTISLTFKNVNESQFKDFHSIAQKVQEEKIFQGKKHYEKIMIISFTDQYYDLEDKYELMGNVEEKINEQLENLMSANDYNVKFGLMKRKETRIKVYQKKIDQDLVNIYMLIQYSQNKIENNIIQKIKRILNTDIYESKQMIRSQIYKNFYRPHTDIFQYPTQNRLLLNNFTYGMQKNLSSQFVTIWDLKDLKDLYENEKEGCQGVCFIEFVHKRNFKDEDKFFIFFTVKVLDYYIPFQLQVQVDSIYTCDLFQNPSVNDFVLFLKIVGFPKISKSFPIQNRFYYHYDFLNWERYSNFLLGKIQEQSNLIKMQILQHQVIQININKEYISENKDSFANIIKLFKEQNKVQFHDLNSKKSPLQGCQYRNYFDEGILSFLEILKNQYSKTKHFLKFQNILAKLVMTKVLDLHMLKDAQVQQKIRQNFKKATALFRLIHLNPQTYSIQNGDLNSFLDYWLSQSQSLKHINQQIKEFLWIPENFCLVNKIIITPSVSIYGNEELIPLSSNFKVSKFYEQDSIVYLLDEDFNLFDFEETDENFFKTIFEKHIKNNTIQIEEISIVYYINAITSRCLQRNCFFATQFEKIDDKQNTFLEYIQKSNVNFTQPIYKCEIQQIQIQGNHSEVGFLNFKLLNKILNDVGYEYTDNKFSSIFLLYKYEDGKDNLCTLFYNEGLPDTNYFIQFMSNDEVKNFDRVTIQIYSINKCKEQGYINQTNLGDFLDCKNLVVQKLSESIKEDKFEGLELSQQLNEVKIWQKVNQLEFYLGKNIYPIQDSFIITGRKAMMNQQKIENIYDKTIHTEKFTIAKVQLKLPNQKGSIKNVLIAKKKGTFVSKFYVFEVLEGGANFKSNEIKINQSIILFHPDFQEYYFWPEFYSQREDVFEHNQKEYIVIINPNSITDEIKQITNKKFEEIEIKRQGQKNQKNSQQKNNGEQYLDEDDGYRNKERQETRGQQFLNGVIKNNIKSQAMLLFYGEHQVDQQDNNKLNQQDNSESYLHELFKELNFDSPSFNLDQFKKEKKNYDFNILLKSKLNHIVYSFDLQYKFQKKEEKLEKVEKNNKIRNLIYELYENIQTQLRNLKDQIKTNPSSYFLFDQFRNVFLQKEISLPEELIRKCIKNMITFYQNLDKLSNQYILQRANIDQKNSLVYNNRKLQYFKLLSNGYYLSIGELIKLYKKFLINEISQDFVDYFNIYFKDELLQERIINLYNEKMKPINYFKNKAFYSQLDKKKMKDQLFLLLREAMFVVNFYFITQDKKLENHDLSQFENNFEELASLEKDDIYSQNFYYNIFPKIIKSIDYSIDDASYIVKKSIKNQLKKQFEQEQEEEDDDDEDDQDKLKDIKDISMIAHESDISISSILDSTINKYL